VSRGHHIGLLLLCLAWLLPGMVGHAPWRGGDGAHFLQFLSLLQGDLLLGRGEDLVAPLYYWVAAGTAWLTSPWLALHDGARLASGLFIALSLFFGARAAREMYGPDHQWAAALLLLGSVGLLVRGHEMNAYTAQLAGAAIALYGMARVASDARGGWALGAGLLCMLLAGGMAEPLLFVAIALALPLLLASHRSRPAMRGLGLGLGLAVVAGGGWVTLLSVQELDLVQALRFDRWLGGDPTKSWYLYFPGILAWYTWPAWPLAGWALYRERRHWQTAGIVLPVLILLGLLALYAPLARPSEASGLILLLPMAVLGAAGLLTLRRGAAKALLWFAVMGLSFLGLVFWVYWSAHDLGYPTRLAARLVRLKIIDTSELRIWALLSGVLVTALWVTVVLKTKRSPLRPALLWAAGMTFVWALLHGLFAGPLDQRLSHAYLARAIAAEVPATSCIRADEVAEQARKLLAYHSGRELLADSSKPCDWLLIQTRRRNESPSPDGWEKRWDGARVGERDERFHLYVRN
jgi:4-amino-4-deoxy-L-arabinose transferase-like glycosyltransferase